MLESAGAQQPHANRPDGGTRTPSLWTNADYIGWWTGNTLSALGTSVSAVAYPLLVLSLTGSVAKAGLIGSANLVGILVTTLWGGALADRVSRRAVLVVGPLVQAAVLAAVAAIVHADQARIPLLALAAVLSGLCSGIILGASTPALRRIVPTELLPTANAQAMGRDMAAQLVGAPLGGVLFAVDPALPFGVDAISFVLAALGALNIRRPLGPDRQAHQTKSTMIQDVAEGIRFVRNQPFLRFVAIMVSLLNMIGQAFLLLLIALVTHRGGSPTTIGVISAMTVAGGLVGSLFAPALARRIRGRVLLRTAMWMYTTGFAVTAVVPEVWQIGLVVCLTGVASAPVNVVLQSYFMQVVPDQLLGRVSAVTRFGAYALEWLGPLLAGLLAGVFGVSAGLLALLVVMVPLTVTLYVSRSLGILGIPISEVSESTVDPGTRETV